MAQSHSRGEHPALTKGLYEISSLAPGTGERVRVRGNFRHGRM